MELSRAMFSINRKIEFIDHMIELEEVGNFRTKNNAPQVSPALTDETVDSQTTLYDDSKDIEYLYLSSNGYFFRFANGYSCWDGIPKLLSKKLLSRIEALPPVQALAIVGLEWLCIFSDGSVTNSGKFPVQGNLSKELYNSDSNSHIRIFQYAPGGGWIIVRADNTMVWEKLPSDLDAILQRREPRDSPIDSISISQFGGWFIRFADGECEWSNLPLDMEQKLIQKIRRRQPIIAALSSESYSCYFLSVGSVNCFNHPRNTLGKVGKWAAGLIPEIPYGVKYTQHIDFKLKKTRE